MAKYAISDLHGYLSIYKQVKEFIKPEDTVYCLGDCGDRGPQPWETIVAVYGDPQWVYLKGNHEDMLVDALKEFQTGNVWLCQDYYLLCCNGGQNTFDSAIESKFLSEWINRLNKLPLEMTIQNDKGQDIHLSHAGFTPLKKDNPDLLWDRTHFVHEWPQTGYDNFYVVHGHTPIDSLSDVFKKKELTHPLIYSNGHKIDIDCGVFHTGKACLLNLDTFESTIFKA